MSGAFEIRGGKRLSGDITPQGAKNEALQILCAVLLTEDEVRISNIPDIKDVNKLIEILQDFNVKVTKNGKGDYTFKADEVNFDYIKSKEFKKDGAKLRGSVMILGPMLARFGEAYMPTPGGDKIGRRRLDTHFQGFVELGAEFSFDEEDQYYSLKAKELNGKFILLEEASVTGTANIVMAAVLAKGKTRIYNAACEPYLQQLCKMLNRMGANITGIGSNLLTIDGVDKLHGTEHTMLPDMVEIGSWIGLAAMTKSEITIKNVNWNQLGVIPNTFRKLGIELEQRGDDIYIPSQEHYKVQKFIDDLFLRFPMRLGPDSPQIYYQLFWL